MTDEQKFMAQTLMDAIRVCGPMLAVDDENSATEGIVGNASLSVTGIVERGPLAGKRVRLTFETVKEETIDE